MDLFYLLSYINWIVLRNFDWAVVDPTNPGKVQIWGYCHREFYVRVTTEDQEMSQ